MADQAAQDQGTSTQDGNQESSATTSGAGDDQKQQAQTITMTSQQLAERLARAKPTDYDDIKTELQQLKQANMSELEKASSKAAQAEQERDAARAEALRLRVAVKHGISDEDAELFLTASDEATLEKQAERLAARDAERAAKGNRSPREGKNPPAAAGDPMREFLRSMKSA